MLMSYSVFNTLQKNAVLLHVILYIIVNKQTVLLLLVMAYNAYERVGKIFATGENEYF